jgi:hypothetical protein
MNQDTRRLLEEARYAIRWLSDPAFRRHSKAGPPRTDVVEAIDAALDPNRKGTWHAGDLELIREGEGEPLLSQEELDRILDEGKS